MVKRINEAFADEDHNLLSEKKKELKEKLKLSKLSWHDYILHTSGVIDIEETN